MPYELTNIRQAPTLFLGTNNKKKIVELVTHLEPRGFAVKIPADFPDLLDVDETGTTFIENARLKAIAQAKHRKLWTIGEDSGLCIQALDGKPGVYSARFSGANATDESNNTLLLEQLRAVPNDQRSAYYVSTIALSDPDGEIHLESYGECWGRILHERRGTEGFGYDPLFEIAEYHRTFAELGLAVKRAISHRSRALRQFLFKLDQALGYDART